MLMIRHIQTDQWGQI